MTEQEEVKLGWGKYSLSARGQMVSFLMVVALSAGFLEYNHATRATAQEKQHDAIVSALEVQTCIQSVPFEERKKLREELVRSLNPLETLRLGWCPWMEKLNNRKRQ